MLDAQAGPSSRPSGTRQWRSTSPRIRSASPFNMGALMNPLQRPAPIPEESVLNFSDREHHETARAAWDPYSTSAQIERQVKIRSCVDLPSVLLTVHPTYRGVLSDLLGKYTDKVEQRDRLTRGRSKLEKLQKKDEFPHS